MIQGGPLHFLAALFAAFSCTGCVDGDLFYVRSAGEDMPVWVRGDTGAGAIVVMVHGGPGGSSLDRTVNPPLQRIEQEFGVAYWDQRAAGNSQGDATPDTMTAEQYAADLDLVVDALSVRYPKRKIFLLGESWGGALTGYYLGDPQHGKKIAGWIDVDGTPDEPGILSASRTWAHDGAAAKVQAGDDVARWQPVVDWYDARPALTLDDLPQHNDYVNQLGGSSRYPDRGSSFDTPGLFLESPFDLLSFLANSDYTTQQLVLTKDPSKSILFRDLSGNLPTVTVPTLLLWGRYDGMCPLPLGQAIFARIGTAPADKSLVILEDAAHKGIIDAPDAVADAVLAFVHAH
jgi:pimeloyl-ACP methyl ester carboxylesterase